MRGRVRGDLNAFELMKALIEAGAGVTSRTSWPRPRSAATWRQGAGAHAGVRAKLAAARLAADVLDVPTILIARTDANSPGFLGRSIADPDAGRSGRR